MTLAEMHCEPCKGGEAKLSEDDIAALLATLPGWRRSGDAISMKLTFPDFASAFAFVGRVAELAEAEDHHPDINFGWGFVECSLTTHAAKGLTRNDFIMAAHIDALAS